MHKNIDINRIKDLEAKWQNGTITNAEALEYAEWYNSDILGQTVEVPEYIATSKEAHREILLKKLIEKLHQEENKSLNKIISITKRVSKYKIAAAVTTLLCITIVVSLLVSKKKNTYNNITEVKPGTDAINLTLSNGNIIKFDANNKNEFYQDGKVLIINKFGSIQYKGIGMNTLYNTAVTKTGQKYMIVLSDNSKVWLNAESSLKYPLAFDNKKREVELIGEAYFEVSHNNKLPFIVKCNQHCIKVLGTHFNISNYNDEVRSTTTLIEGKIVAFTQNTIDTLAPGEEIIVEKNTKARLTRNIDTSNVIAWKNNKFSFNNDNLIAISKKLHRWYGIDVIVANDSKNTMELSGKTPMNRNLSEVLKVLDFAGIHNNFKNDKLYIY